jgi:hypothetical protein
MTKAIPFLLQGKNLILVIDGKSHTISKDTHIAYGKIVEALKNQDWDEITDLVSPKAVLTNFGSGNITIDGNKILWKGQPFHNALATRMIEMYQDGFPIEPMVLFMENLMKNPSKRSVDQLYVFLEKNKLPITEDGYFLAFKRVRNDYLDIHSGTISNHVGAIVEMDRNMVDDNPDSHCSTGLHFCSESYLDHFGTSSQPVMILKINPADVVSIPTDYDGAKGRCMRYEVVGEVVGDASQAFTSAVNSDYTSEPEPVKVDKAKWPFPTGPEVVHSDFDDSADKVWNEDKPDFETDDHQLYDLQRVHGGWAEYKGLTLEEAENRMFKNISQKKAQLKIVKSGTDEEI